MTAPRWVIPAFPLPPVTSPGLAAILRGNEVQLGGTCQVHVPTLGNPIQRAHLCLLTSILG